MSGRLFVVGTPIGNLGDLTQRARETLERVDLVAAEDTRRTGRLLERLGIDAELVSLFEGNEARRTGTVLEALRAGRDVALVSDAGMPAISDPGHPLLRACVAEGIEVRVIPGPSAVTAALVLSGLPTDRFVFEGFLPRTAGARRARLRALASDPRTVVLFESPRRIGPLLREVLDELGDRPAALLREITKLHEEAIRGRLSEIGDALGDREVKGELVLVLGGAPASAAPDVREMAAEADALVAAGLRRRDAAAEVARRHGASTNEIYRVLVEERQPGASSGP